jgi:hypothetical protein
VSLDQIGETSRIGAHHLFKIGVHIEHRKVSWQNPLASLTSPTLLPPFKTINVGIALTL